MTFREACAREARFRRMIKAMNAAVTAMRAVGEHEPIVSADSTTRHVLQHSIEEYSGYLAQATWWRSTLHDVD